MVRPRRPQGLADPLGPGGGKPSRTYRRECCARCGTPLSRYNPGKLCGACELAVQSHHVPAGQTLYPAAAARSAGTPEPDQGHRVPQRRKQQG